MKKSIVAIIVGLMMMGVSGKAWAGSVVAADLACTNPTGCVQDYEISDSAVTAPKIEAGAVTTAKIANGAVTDTQISGTISGTKLGAHTHNGSEIVDGTVGASKITDGAVTTNKLADWSVSGTKIVDYSVTDTKIANGAVTGSRIADGAITDAKITGPISATKLEKVENVVVVAKSGGDFTSISAALAAINPTADNPYLIKVMPGTYQEFIGMKSHVHLQGAGPDVTIIDNRQCGGCSAISNYYVTDVEISGFTISGGAPGIYNYWSQKVTISGNWIIDGLGAGIQVLNTGQVTIVNNVIKGNHGGTGLEIAGTDDATVIKNNSFSQNYQGITLWSQPSGTVGQNVIMSNDHSGIAVGHWLLKIYHNVITNNNIADIYSYNYPTQPVSNISFNVFDTITGIYGDPIWGGNYNVKSDGTPVR